VRLDSYFFYYVNAGCTTYSLTRLWRSCHDARAVLSYWS